jgi:hypothetical protein
MNSQLYVNKNRLEAKVDSLQDKKNYWVELKSSSVPVEVPVDLANNFISDCDKQIRTLESSISTIRKDPEYKRLGEKAQGFLPFKKSSNGSKLMIGSLLGGLIVISYKVAKDKRKAKQQS